ncbi:MAG: hypothetical protein GX793_03160 [Bacteroidales bacterium]|nr:hypothetical protein [Bacteroidales bacterium]
MNKKSFIGLMLCATLCFSFGLNVFSLNSKSSEVQQEFPEVREQREIHLEIKDTYDKIEELEKKAYEDGVVSEDENRQYKELIKKTEKLAEEDRLAKKFSNDSIQSTDEEDKDSVLYLIESARELAQMQALALKHNAKAYKQATNQLEFIDKLEEDFLNNRLSIKEAKEKIKDFGSIE